MRQGKKGGRGREGWKREEVSLQEKWYEWSCSDRKFILRKKLHLNKLATWKSTKINVQRGHINTKTNTPKREKNKGSKQKSYKRTEDMNRSKLKRYQFLPFLVTKMKILIIPALGQVWGEKSSCFWSPSRAPSGHRWTAYNKCISFIGNPIEYHKVGKVRMISQNIPGTEVFKQIVTKHLKHTWHRYRGCCKNE